MILMSQLLPSNSTVKVRYLIILKARMIVSRQILTSMGSIQIIILITTIINLITLKQVAMISSTTVKISSSTMILIIVHTMVLKGNILNKLKAMVMINNPTTNTINSIMDNSHQQLNLECTIQRLNLQRVISSLMHRLMLRIRNITISTTSTIMDNSIPPLEINQLNIINNLLRTKLTQELMASMQQEQKTSLKTDLRSSLNSSQLNEGRDPFT